MLATAQKEEVGHNKAWELSTWEKQYVTTARCWRSYHDRVATRSHLTWKVSMLFYVSILNKLDTQRGHEEIL